MPERVARQFGRVQQIPPPPIELMVGTQLTDQTRPFKKVYGDGDYTWTNMEHHHVSRARMGPRAYIATATAEGYMDWYLPRTHVMLHNPERGEYPVQTNTIYSASQQRLQPMRQRLQGLQQYMQSQTNVDPFVLSQIEELQREAGTGGLPGVQPGPMSTWFGAEGSSTARRRQHYREPTSPTFHFYPGAVPNQEDLNSGDDIGVDEEPNVGADDQGDDEDDSSSEEE